MPVLREGAPTIERTDPRMLTGDTIYLFNIYSHSEMINLGSAGMYFMPACPDDKEYVRSPNTIPGTVEDTYPHFTDHEEYRTRLLVGADVAKCFLGIGPGDKADDVDRRRFGWFTSTNPVPSKAELATAKAALIKFLTAKIRKGDELASSSNPKDRESVDDSFYLAAKKLNVKRPWMSEATEMTLCPFCSIPVRPAASKCSGCGEVINAKAYEEQKKQIGAGA